MEKGTTHVGMDVHRKDIAVAMLVPGSSEPVSWTVANEETAVRRLAKKLRRESSGEVVCAYEAGACGYALQRQLRGHGIACQVVAPSLIPRKPGEHIKTDRRDARKIAEMLRAGLLTEVHPPTVEEEAIRDLCRCREDARHDLLQARQRLLKMLLRQGLIFTETRHWTYKHRAWLRGLTLENETSQAVYVDYLVTVEMMEERKRGLEEKLLEVAQTEPYAEPVGWLRCFRGIETVTAITLLAELHDFRRFTAPRQLMAYLGLVPREHSSGDSTRRGGLTKAGNAHARRLLVEAAWHYRLRPAVGYELRRRRQGQPAEIIALADRAQRRLHRRWTRLVYGRSKSPNKATVAVARELVGFVWAALYLYPQERRIKAVK